MPEILAALYARVSSEQQAEEHTIDSHNFGAFLCKAQHRGTPVAHPFAWALTRADNNGGLSF